MLLRKLLLLDGEGHRSSVASAGVVTEDDIKKRIGFARSLGGYRR